MTGGSGKNIAASVRQRLLNLRETRGEDYNALLTQYAIERFLFRLCTSGQAERFVLKGALLFRAWSGALHRPTKDLDLLGSGDPSPEAVVSTIRQVIATPVEDDGIRFDTSSLEARELREEQEYGGIRIKLTALLGSARIPMQIDVGFGDAVTPEPRIQRYPTLLNMGAPLLRMYPPETVIAEKMEAMIVLGMTNSRMKDYFDLMVLLRGEGLTDYRLVEAIVATFRRRKTRLPERIPPGLSDEFGHDDRAQRLWGGFIRRIKVGYMETDFALVVATLRDRIWPVLTRAWMANQDDS